MDLAASLLGRCTFPAAPASVTAAVSGGADSLALLVLVSRAELDVTAVHVDHGLREGSAAEADVVAAVAARFGARFRAESVHVDAGPNLEARAREARYAVLPDDVLTGHTADDQAETVLLNLMRGSGLPGLAGMRDDGRRPLLRLRRIETAALCRELGLEPVADPSNDDSRFRRNRVRHELLPLLDDIAQRDVAEVVAAQSSRLADEADLLAGLASLLDPSDARVLAAANPALARLAIRAWLAPAGDGHPPDAATVERVLGVARGHAVGTDVGANWSVRRTDGRLRLIAPPAS